MASDVFRPFFQVMLFFMLQRPILGTIHRLECRRDAVYKATDKEKALTLTDGNFLAITNVTKLAKCAKQCTSHTQCRSFNFKKKGSNNCQILDIDKRNSSGKIENAPGWIHYDPVAMVSPRCRFVICNPGYRCIDNCSLSNGFDCIDINECESSPCQNGGTCSNEVNKYTCTCAPGYTGTNCQTDINECESNPCLNGATCNDLVNKYICICAPGYESTNCQTDIDECSSTPCKNGATCNNLIDKYTCTCVPGYQGVDCEIDINECDSNPCQNGGTCSNEVNKYTCTCVPGYTGTNCQTEINECASSPCQNGASCNDMLNRYTCTCVSGYQGTRCETDINECSSTPCQNGATCNDLVNSYTCTCAAGYQGTTCATDINECSSSPCQNGGTCNDHVNSYSCSCTSEFGGTQCQTATSCPSSYSWLTGSDRAVSFYDGTAICDSGLTAGWYRFGSPAGTQMITGPPANYGTQFRCKTHGGGWLNGAHPSIGDGEVVRQVCFAWGGNTCWTTMNIKVFNCGSYYLYYLYPPSSCHARYCGNY